MELPDSEKATMGVDLAEVWNREVPYTSVLLWFQSQGYEGGRLVTVVACAESYTRLGRLHIGPACRGLD
jgi:hypothetical protein